MQRVVRFRPPGKRSMFLSHLEDTTILMESFKQQPYNGATTKLCLAFDIGTSFSSISYCILNPGQAPVIRNVNRCDGYTTVAGAMPLTELLQVSSSTPRRSYREGPLRNLLRSGWKNSCDWRGGIRPRDQCRGSG